MKKMLIQYRTLFPFTILQANAIDLPKSQSFLSSSRTNPDCVIVLPSRNAFYLSNNCNVLNNLFTVFFFSVFFR